MNGPCTAEDGGRKILAIYGFHHVLAGEMLLFQTLQICFEDTNAYYNHDALLSGLTWLEENGFIEQKDGRNGMFFLTKKGAMAL